MDHETEAACLLRTGNLFPRRVGLLDADGGMSFVGVKHGAFALYQGDEPYFHYDLEGRWQRTFDKGTHYRKALDGTVDAIDRVRDGPGLVLRRRALNPAETAERDEAVRRAARQIADSLDTNRYEAVPPPEGRRALKVDELRNLLGRIIRWDSSAWSAHRALYDETYGPIGILPPDAHGSVILQATTGTADGLAFGGAQPHTHHVRDAEAFESHVRAVATLLGRRVAQCRTVYLGGADVSRLPGDHVEALFETIHRHLPINPEAASVRLSELHEDASRLAGIDLLLDDYRPPLPDRAGWAALVSRHLGRVNLGLESGAPEVRALHGRTWTDDDLKRLAADLKSQGVPLGVMLLIGSGGSEYADRHLEATSLLVNALPLGRGDLVYLLDAAEVGDASLGGQVTPLDPAARAVQQASLKDQLAPLRERSRAKVVPYSLEKQWN